MTAMLAHSAIPHFAIAALWATWILYWVIAARGAKPTRWREPVSRQWRHSVPFLLCLVLLAAPGLLPRPLTARLLPPGLALPAAGMVAVAAGLGFAVWARLWLGGNWSSRVEIKQEHSLVRSGPYRLVRHPIYSGLLLAVAGTALAIGEWRGVLALVLALIGCLLRIAAEEREMGRNFPEYRQYRASTAALIPFLL